MSPLVIDASTILSFVLVDEKSAATTHVQEKLSTWKDVYVPCHWQLEIANALLMAERRGRLQAFEVPIALEYIAAFSITVDDETAARSGDETFGLARDYGLTIYDAAYLELAIRLRAVLATSDKALARAASSAGIELLR